MRIGIRQFLIACLTLVGVTASVWADDRVAIKSPVAAPNASGYWADTSATESTLESATSTATTSEAAADHLDVTLGDCDALDDDCDRCGPRWIVRGGAVILRRESPSRRTLFTNFNGTTELMNAGGFDYGSTGGIDLSAIRRLDDSRSVELRYFGINGWDAQQNSVSTGGLFTGGFRLQPLPIFLGEPGSILGPSTTTINASSESKLHSFEVNLRRQSNSWLTVLGGFRYFEVNDVFTASGFVNRPSPFDQFVTMDANTNNHLFGFQIGGEAALLRRGIFTLEGSGKIGAYYNRADVSANYTRLGFLPFPDFSLTDRDDHLSFAGELGIVGAVQLTSRLSARLGYQLLWIDGVAVATDQPTTLVPTQTINMGSTPFYHGASANLEYAF